MDLRLNSSHLACECRVGFYVLQHIQLFFLCNILHIQNKCLSSQQINHLELAATAIRQTIMEKTFDTLAKAMKYVELDIEGSFGRKGTYSDFMNHTKKVIIHGNRIYKEFDWGCFLSVFEHTTIWSLDESMLRCDLEAYKKFGKYCRYIFMISRRDGIFKVESYPIPIDIE